MKNVGSNLLYFTFILNATLLYEHFKKLIRLNQYAINGSTVGNILYIKLLL